MEMIDPETERSEQGTIANDIICRDDRNSVFHDGAQPRLVSKNQAVRAAVDKDYQINSMAAEESLVGGAEWFDTRFGEGINRCFTRASAEPLGQPFFREIRQLL